MPRPMKFVAIPVLVTAHQEYGIQLEYAVSKHTVTVTTTDDCGNDSSQDSPLPSPIQNPQQLLPEQMAKGNVKELTTIPTQNTRHGYIK